MLQQESYLYESCSSSFLWKSDPVILYKVTNRISQKFNFCSLGNSQTSEKNLSGTDQKVFQNVVWNKSPKLSSWKGWTTALFLPFWNISGTARSLVSDSPLELSQSLAGCLGSQATKELATSHPVLLAPTKNVRPSRERQLPDSLWALVGNGQKSWQKTQRVSFRTSSQFTCSEGRFWFWMNHYVLVIKNIKVFSQKNFWAAADAMPVLGVNH